MLPEFVLEEVYKYLNLRDHVILMSTNSQVYDQLEGFKIGGHPGYWEEKRMEKEKTHLLSYCLHCCCLCWCH